MTISHQGKKVQDQNKKKALNDRRENGEDLEEINQSGWMNNTSSQALE